MLFRKIKTLRTLYRKQTGQIFGGDALAIWLQAIATDPDVSKIVEIGAWEGKGSTRVLAKAVSTRPDVNSVSILSLEAAQKRAKRAQKRNRKFHFVEVVWGSIVAEQDLDYQDLNENENLWIAEDINALKNCPRVLDSIPNSIDALFLDGGEFSTRKEYDLLFERVKKWLILDDTLSRKSAAIAKMIREDSAPFVVLIDSHQRNGFMIALIKEKSALAPIDSV